MGLHSLQPAEGSVNRDGKRLGRGQGSGKGGTAARGHKGAKSRSGYSKKIEGTGLGLAIAGEASDRLNGELSARKSDNGVNFQIEISK